MSWHSWFALVGGLLSIISQFWSGTEYYLPAIGGLLALIAGIAMMMNMKH